MNNRQAALAYGHSGWQVIPIWWTNDNRCGCGDPYCNAPGKHPLIRAGKKLAGASSSKSQIEKWWDQWPRANVAVTCGQDSGIVVIDCDMHEDHDGHVEFLQWCAERGIDVGNALVAETGGGGRHVIFQYPGVPIKNVVGWLEHVDVKSDGGYVLMAPSSHVSGREYRWLSARGTRPPPMPPSLASALSTARSRFKGAETGGNAGVPGGYDHQRCIREGPRIGERDYFFNARAFELRKGLDSRGKPVTWDAALQDMRALFDMTEQSTEDPFLWKTVEDKLRRVWDDPDIAPEGLTPEQLAWVESHGEEGEPPEAFSPIRLVIDDPAKISYSDMGNAWRLIRHAGDVIRWSSSAASNGFFVWDGRRWQPDQLEQVREFAREAINAFARESALIEDDDHQKKALQWANASRQNPRTRGMIEQIQAYQEIKVSITDFDPLDAQWFLTVPNGTIDLRTGELLSHEPAHMITRMSQVEYDPEARDDRWDHYLKTATNGDQDLIAYLQRAAGYTLTGSTREEILFMLHGPPASGKSTFVAALQTVLGEYAFSTPAESLMHRRGRAGGPPKDEIASWRGARMLASVEPTEGDRLDESVIKSMTGGDRVVGRHLYRDRFEFTPTYKLWIAANSAPRTRDLAMFRRIRRVPFPVRIELKDRDLTLKDWLTRPDTPGARAVLRWAVEGARLWNERGVGSCALVDADTDEYRTEQDVVAQFITECLRVHGDRQRGIALRDVYETYSQWITRMGERPWTQITFTRKLKDIEFEHEFHVDQRRGRPNQLLGADILPDSKITWPAGGVT